jgi:hypothetical protein
MRSVLVLSAGALMVLSSAAHAFLGWPLLRGDLKSAGVAENLVGAMAVGWYFGSVAMLAFGAITLRSEILLRKGDRSGVVPVRMIATCYLIFGLVTFVSRNFNPHFLLFIVTGLLAGVPVLGRDRPTPGA